MKKEYIMAGVTVLLWSTLAPITKLMLADITSMELLFITSAIATVFFLIANMATGKIKALKNYKPSDYLIMSLLGLLGLFLYSVLYYTGLDELTAQDACIINYSWPLMIVIFSCIILKEKFTLRKFIAIVISFAGVIVISTKGDFSGTSSLGNLHGVLCCLGAAVSYGLFSVLNKKKNYDQFILMTIFFGITTLGAGAFVLVQGSAFRINTNQILGMIWLGVFVDAVAYLFWAIALNSGDTAKISNLAYCTPVASVIISAVFLKEEINLFSLIGLALILLGIIIQLVKPKKQQCKNN